MTRRRSKDTEMVDGSFEMIEQFEGCDFFVKTLVKTAKILWNSS